MPEIKKRKSRVWLLILLISLGLFDLAVLIRYLTQGKNIALLNPKGYIAEQQHELMIFTAVAMLAIAIPTLILFYFIAWRYRETSDKAIVHPAASKSKRLVVTMWLLPTVIAVVIAAALVPATHRLAPQKSIASDKEPLKIQVIALRWKWLFLYPEEGIATVNFVQFPVDRPVTFEMTADETPMSSLWIPNLGGQLYVMTSHVNKLNLMADTAGDYRGSTPEINGAGFTGMKFTARASSDLDYDQWVASVQQSSSSLSQNLYDEMVEPSENNHVAMYSAYDTNLYDTVISKYAGSSEGHSHGESLNEEPAQEGHSH